MSAFAAVLRPIGAPAEAPRGAAAPAPPGPAGTYVKAGVPGGAAAGACSTCRTKRGLERPTLSFTR